MSQVFEHFKLHVHHGNYNLAWRCLTDRWKDLSLSQRVRALEWLRHYMEEGGYLTSETIQRINATIPQSTLDDHSLLPVIAAYRSSPPSAWPVG